MRIDGHQHYWSISRTDYGWITPELPVLYRDYLPEDLEIHLKKNSIDSTITVQAALRISKQSICLHLPIVRTRFYASVGGLDLFDPSHWEYFERWREHPKSKDLEQVLALQQKVFFVLHAGGGIMC